MSAESEIELYNVQTDILYEFVKKESSESLHVEEKLPVVVVNSEISEELKNVEAEIQEIITEQLQTNHFIWCIDDFKEKLEQKKLYGYDATFFTALKGYLVKVQIFVKDGYLGIYLNLLVGPHDDILQWPFSKQIIFTLLNQVDDQGDRTGVLKPNQTNSGESVKWKRPVSGYEQGLGFRKFIKTRELIGNNYCSPFLRNNRICFRVDFD